jgi:hypothetical protein
VFIFYWAFRLILSVFWGFRPAGRAPPGAFLFVQANKKEAKNGFFYFWCGETVGHLCNRCNEDDFGSIQLKAKGPGSQAHTG